MNKLLANLMLTIHFLWAILLILLVPLIWLSLINSKVVWIILGTTILGEIIYLGGCPLTVWEKKFRKKAGQDLYDGTCIGHHLKKYTNISISDNKIQGIVITWFLIILISVLVK